jgi:hypothetical protein
MIFQPDNQRLARLRYTLSSYQVLSPGDYVLCAVSGARINLDDLKYWSHERQEAYASAMLATKRHQETSQD